MILVDIVQIPDPNKDPILVNRAGNLPTHDDAVRVTMTGEHYRKPEETLRLLGLNPTGIKSSKRSNRIICRDDELGLVALDDSAGKGYLTLLYAEIEERSVGFILPPPRLFGLGGRKETYEPGVSLQLEYERNSEAQVCALMEELSRTLINYDQQISSNPDRKNIKGLPDIINY